MKINIGSGSKRYPGFLNIDNDPGSNPDFVVNLETEPLPFESDSIDEVLAHHVLEHLGDGFFHCIKELYRVCKHGATISVHVPHPQHDTFLIDPTHKRPILPHTLDMFSKTRNKRDMDSGGCETPLGFIHDVDIYVKDWVPVLDEYWIPKFQQMTEEQCDYTARTFNNVIVEYRMILFVKKQDQATR